MIPKHKFVSILQEDASRTTSAVYKHQTDTSSPVPAPSISVTVPVPVSDRSGTGLPPRFCKRTTAESAHPDSPGQQWDTLEEDVDKAIGWLREQVIQLKEQDKILIKQFLDLGSAISKLHDEERRPRTSSFTSSSISRSILRPRTSSFTSMRGPSPLSTSFTSLHNGFFHDSTDSLDEEVITPRRVSPLVTEEEVARYTPDSVLIPRTGKSLTRPHIYWAIEDEQDGLKSSDV